MNIYCYPIRLVAVYRVSYFMPKLYVYRYRAWFLYRGFVVKRKLHRLWAEVSIQRFRCKAQGTSLVGGGLYTEVSFYMRKLVSQ